MGLFDRFKKDNKKEAEPEKEVMAVSEPEDQVKSEEQPVAEDPVKTEEQPEAEKPNEVKEESDFEDKLLLGVLDVFQITDSADLVVVGMLRGTLSVGERVNISNPGDDDGLVFATTVAMIENGPQSQVKTASNCQVALRLENGKQHPFKIGSVVYAGNVSDQELHDTYISALGDGYIMAKKMQISEGDIHRMSLTDCAEVWRLYAWFRSNNLKSQSDEEKAETKRNVDILGKALCEKVLNADAIYCIYNKKTGEPHMFSRTVKQNNRYECMPPDIMIFTEAYKEVMSTNFENDMTEVRKIENGKEKKGIYNFLSGAFYLNGACGIAVLSEQVGIAAQMLVPPPNYADANPKDIPVENPDLVRWMLLMTQMPQPQTEDQKLIYNLYYRFMGKEMVKARFLIPMMKDREFPPADEDGKVTIQEDTQIAFATMKGRFEKDAVLMYTDWKRLRKAYDKEWDAAVQPIGGMIDVMDCAINVTEHRDAGVYVNKQIYKDMMKL